MLKIFVSYMLGPWGMKVLEFYIRNSAIINSIVFIYGIILVLSHVNYKRITGDCLDLIKKDKDNNSKKKIYRINWEKEISENSFFPMIAGQTSLIPKKVSLENLKFYLLKDKNWMKTIEGLKINEQ